MTAGAQPFVLEGVVSAEDCDVVTLRGNDFAEAVGQRTGEMYPGPIDWGKR